VSALAKSAAGALPPRTDTNETTRAPGSIETRPTAQPEPRIEARGVCKIFAQRPAAAMAMLREGRGKDEIFAELGAVVGVNDASFSVRPGEVFVVMGLSGSGKSTLVRLLNRLIEPTGGAVLIDGVDLTAMSKRELIGIRRRDMSFVFQSFALMPHLTALDNAAFGLAMAKVPRAQRREAAQAALEKVGLGAYAERYPHEMSGGMQQRVGLARALAKNPTIMFMDEAFSALDPLIRTEMQDELLRLQREDQRTIVFISHDLDEAMRIGDRIAIMEGGRIVQVGQPVEILRDPADTYVASFFRNVDVSKVLRAQDVAEAAGTCTVSADAEPRAALASLKAANQGFGYVVDADRRFCGVVSALSLEQAARRPGGTLDDALLPGCQPVPALSRLKDLLRPVAACEWPLPLVDAEHRFAGAVSRADLLRTLDRGD
jgi:glycine betaine/proline transport system ATP-binding protein